MPLWGAKLAFERFCGVGKFDGWWVAGDGDFAPTIFGGAAIDGCGWHVNEGGGNLFIEARRWETYYLLYRSGGWILPRLKEWDGWDGCKA